MESYKEACSLAARAYHDLVTNGPDVLLFLRYFERGDWEFVKCKNAHPLLLYLLAGKFP